MAKTTTGMPPLQTELLQVEARNAAALGIEMIERERLMKFCSRMYNPEIAALIVDEAMIYLESIRERLMNPEEEV